MESVQNGAWLWVNNDISVNHCFYRSTSLFPFPGLGLRRPRASCKLVYVAVPLFSFRPEQNLLHPGHGGTYIRDDAHPRG